MPSTAFSDSDRNLFETELKLSVNRRLYENNIISEDLYLAAKEYLQNTLANLGRK